MSKRPADDSTSELMATHEPFAKRPKLNIDDLFEQEIYWSADDPRALVFYGYKFYLDDSQPPKTQHETRVLMFLAFVLSAKLRSGAFVVYGTQWFYTYYDHKRAVDFEQDARLYNRGSLPALVFRGGNEYDGDEVSYTLIRPNTMFVPRDQIIALADADYVLASTGDPDARIAKNLGIFIDLDKIHKDSVFNDARLASDLFSRDIVIDMHTMQTKSKQLGDDTLRVFTETIIFHVVFWNPREMVTCEGRLTVRNGYFEKDFSYVRQKYNWSLPNNLPSSWHSICDSKLLKNVTIVYADTGLEVENLSQYRLMPASDQRPIEFRFGGGSATKVAKARESTNVDKCEQV